MRQIQWTERGNPWGYGGNRGQGAENREQIAAERWMVEDGMRERQVHMTIKRAASGWNLRRVSTHPGEMLRKEFLIPLGITQNALAMRIRVPATRIGDIVHGRRAITPDTALRLARFFGNSPEFWLNLQQMHDLSRARLELSKTIERDVEAYAGA